MRATVSVKTAERAERLYLKGLSLAEVGDRLGLTLGQVHWQLKKRGTKMRAAGTGRAVSGKVDDRAGRAVQLYQGGATIMEVAAAVGLSKSTVSYHLKKRGVDMRPSGIRPGSRLPRRPRVRTGPPPWLEKAREMYEAGNSLGAIGDAVGSSNMTVRKHLVAAGVQMRTRGGARPNPGRRRPDWEAGAGERYEAGDSCAEIARDLGVCDTTVRKALMRMGVPIRRRKESASVTGEEPVARQARQTSGEAGSNPAGRTTSADQAPCPICGAGDTGVKRPGYGMMPIWRMYPGGEGWAL